MSHSVRLVFVVQTEPNRTEPWSAQVLSSPIFINLKFIVQILVKSVINVRETLHDRFLENDDVKIIGSPGSKRRIMSPFTLENRKTAHLWKIRTVLGYTFNRRSPNPEAHIIIIHISGANYCKINFQWESLREWPLLPSGCVFKLTPCRRPLLLPTEFKSKLRGTAKSPPSSILRTW